ncbi:MAG: hypothetical protein ACI4SO_05195 [Muribaculaceae bacterium]
MIGNTCLLGQIATFIEALGLSYREVVYEIPYRNLLIMSKDKSRPCYGKKVVQTTGREMMMRRMQMLSGSE